MTILIVNRLITSIDFIMQKVHFMPSKCKEKKCFFFATLKPFKVWCGCCNSMIVEGVRFNVEKKQVGNYYSTKGKLHFLNS
ncbi:putative saf4/Yju2 protein [Helianthus annuus]|nr:putative saf4/Yju2 protein [Helianthus annuus]